jgi:hypothetical protein
MAKFYCVYIKSDYEPLIRPYVFTEEVPYRRFIAGAEEDDTYWGRRLMTSMPTEHEREPGRFAAPVMMA